MESNAENEILDAKESGWAMGLAFRREEIRRLDEQRELHCDKCGKLFRLLFIDNPGFRKHGGLLVRYKSNDIPICHPCMQIMFRNSGQ
jgi:hypothetical protein